MGSFKYSEMDENYYAMIVKSPYMGNRNENPLVHCRGTHEDSRLYTLVDENKKDVKFLDLMNDKKNKISQEEQMTPNISQTQINIKPCKYRPALSILYRYQFR